MLDATSDSSIFATVVVIDDAESYFPKERLCDNVDSNRLFEFLQFCNRVSKLHDATKVVVLALARNPQLLHPLFFNQIDETVAMEAPNSERRLVVWKWFLGALKEQPNRDFNDIAASLNIRANGFCGLDIQAVCSDALHCALMQGVPVRSSHLEECFANYSDRRLASIDSTSCPWEFIPANTTGVRWRDIGGLDEVKLALNEMVVWPAKFSKLYDRMGAQAPLGIVMHGAPGTGKTLLAKALAMEASANFLSVSIGSLIRGEVGESEKALSPAVSCSSPMLSLRGILR